MELNDKVTQLEDEIKILKNEVQAVLLDLRESYLNHENPFNPSVSPIVSQPIIINQPAPVIEKPVVPVAPDGIGQKEIQASESQIEETVESAVLDMESKPEAECPQFQPEGLEEPELVFKQGLSVSTKTAQEEVTRAWRPETETAAHFKSKEATDSANEKVDLAIIARLAQWVDKAVKQLGQERTEAILDISEMMGHLNQELKDILVRFINLGQEEHPAKVTTRDYLAALIELDSLLGRDNKSEVALLYILCQENDHR